MHRSKIFLLGSLFLTASAVAQPVDADLIAIEGGTVNTRGAATIVGLDFQFTNGQGELAFGVDIDEGGGSDGSIWCDGSIVWQNSDSISPVLAGGEASIGVGNDCQFIYSPSIDTEDGVWTDLGLLAVENTAAPDFGLDTLSTFHSRPFMTPDGSAYWVAGYNNGAGGTSTVGRMLYTSSDRTSGATQVVLRSGDVIDGLTIDEPSGIGFDYFISDNNQHHIQELLMDTGSTANDGVMYVDGSIAAREGSLVEPPAAGGGENWDNFDFMSVNNDGVYVFTGDTDGSTATDEFIAVGGFSGEGIGGGNSPEIRVREGDVVDGFTLSGSMQGASIYNGGFVAWASQTTDATASEVVYVGFHDDLDLSTAVLRVGDEIDIDNNGVMDYVVADFNGGRDQFAGGDQLW